MNVLAKHTKKKCLEVTTESYEKQRQGRKVVGTAVSSGTETETNILAYIVYICS